MEIKEKRERREGREIKEEERGEKETRNGLKRMETMKRIVDLILLTTRWRAKPVILNLY